MGSTYLAVSEEKEAALGGRRFSDLRRTFQLGRIEQDDLKSAIFRWKILRMERRGDLEFDNRTINQKSTSL
jgi:hypothetical protein